MFTFHPGCFFRKYVLQVRPGLLLVSFSLKLLFSISLPPSLHFHSFLFTLNPDCSLKIFFFECISDCFFENYLCNFVPTCCLIIYRWKLFVRMSFPPLSKFKVFVYFQPGLLLETVLLRFHSGLHFENLLVWFCPGLLCGTYRWELFFSIWPSPSLSNFKVGGVRACWAYLHGFYSLSTLNYDSFCLDKIERQPNRFTIQKRKENMLHNTNFLFERSPLPTQRSGQLCLVPWWALPIVPGPGPPAVNTWREFSFCVQFVLYSRK